MGLKNWKLQTDSKHKYIVGNRNLKKVWPKIKTIPFLPFNLVNFVNKNLNFMIFKNQENPFSLEKVYFNF